MSCEIVVVGISGSDLGPSAALFWGLPASFPLPIVVVSNGPGEGLPSRLQSLSALPVCEVEDKDPILPGRIHLAPPDYHLLIESGGLALSTDVPVWSARPSIDVLFSSAADVFGDRAAGILLKRVGQDGRAGLERLKERGGLVWTHGNITVSQIAKKLTQLGDLAGEAL